jgi:predicted DNA-binding transcriptional regulator AlpA
VSNLQQLITPGQLAQILGFSKKSIYVLASRGSSSLPPYFHVGKALRWHPVVVQNWIDQQAGLSLSAGITATSTAHDCLHDVDQQSETRTLPVEGEKK